VTVKLYLPVPSGQLATGHTVGQGGHAGRGNCFLISQNYADGLPNMVIFSPLRDAFKITIILLFNAKLNWSPNLDRNYLELSMPSPFRNFFKHE
jgi:hypothetical protein